MKVTVLMSVHNGLPYLPEAVASILAQSFREFEFLILDDASTDGTREFLRQQSDPRIRVIELPQNIGLTAALNVGLREARGEFIARQDADDISDPRRLALQLRFLSAHPSCAVVGSQARLIDENGRSLGKKNFPLDYRGIAFAHLFDNALAHSAVMFRKATVDRYDEAWPASQDYELWSRMSARHALANLPDRLLALRMVNTSITQTHKRPELIRRVQAAHFERLFGSPASESALDTIALFRTRVEPGKLGAFRELLADLIARSEAAWPGVSGTADFRRTLAAIHERVGYNLLAQSRGAGLAEIARALKCWPLAIFGMPWLRIGALAVLGDSARRVYEKAGQIPEVLRRWRKT